MEENVTERTLLAELARAVELVRQLETHLDHPSPIDFCKSLMPKILSSIHKSILMAKSSNPDGESPRSMSNSPRSENYSPVFKDHDRREMKKIKKTLHTWTSRVRLSSCARGVEGPGDDGYSWRKYGQKDILGAKHPRAYYRCTHRNTRGCPATKQVQRSDEDPLVFDITYHRTHTCLKGPQASLQQDHNQNLRPSSQTGLKVETTEGLEDSEDAQAQTSLSFGSMADIFPSPSFLSPANSESTYFSMSPYQINSFDGAMKVETSGSDETEIVISRANSGTNSSLIDMDFVIEELDFNQDFLFDASILFS